MPFDSSTFTIPHPDLQKLDKILGSLTEQKWTQHNLYSGGARCMWGFLNWVKADHDLRKIVALSIPGVKSVDHHHGDCGVYPTVESMIISYNDTFQRKFKDVRDVFVRAREKVAKRQQAIWLPAAPAIVRIESLKDVDLQTLLA